MAEATAEKRVNVPAETFVKAWQASNSLDEVIEKLNAEGHEVQAGSLTTRAAGYRSKGINLKKFPRQGGRSLDVEALKKLIESN